MPDLIHPLPGKLGRSLEDNLQEEERLEVSLSPRVGQAIVVTDRRVMIIKAGNVTGAGFFAARTRSFPFSQISSVDLRIGLMGGHMKISVAGQVDPQDRHSGLTGMMEAENAIVFLGKYKDAFKEIADIIRRRMSEARSAGEHPSAATAHSDLAGQLAELGRLREQGVLTEDEFNRAKSRLLA